MTVLRQLLLAPVVGQDLVPMGFGHDATVLLQFRGVAVLYRYGDWPGRAAWRRGSNGVHSYSISSGPIAGHKLLDLLCLGKEMNHRQR